MLHFMPYFGVCCHPFASVWSHWSRKTT